jgi:AcrR family transcriptional regulator
MAFNAGLLVGREYASCRSYRQLAFEDATVAKPPPHDTQYFPSKEALVAALVERHTTETTALVRTKLAEVAQAPLPVAVRTMIDAMFEAHMVDPKLHKVLIEQVPRVGKLERVHGLQREAQAMVELLHGRPANLSH